MTPSRPAGPALVVCFLLLSLGLLGGSCVSARSETARAPADAGVDTADAGPPCRPLTCVQARARCGVISDGCGGSVDCGPCTSPCGPEEMNCCGSCIPRSEGRCPDNIHCRPTTAPNEKATE